MNDLESMINKYIKNTVDYVYSQLFVLLFKTYGLWKKMRKYFTNLAKW